MAHSDAADQTAPQRPARRRRRPVLWLGLGLLALALLLAFGGLAVTGKPVRLPVWVVAEAEARLNANLGPGALAPGGAFAVGGAEVVVDPSWVPHLRITDLRMLAPGGATVVALPEVAVAMNGAALLRGQLRPGALRITGAALTLRRMADGRIDLGLGPLMQGNPPRDLAELLNRVEAVFAHPALSQLSGIEAEALSLTLEDARAGRSWQLGDGRVTLDNRPGELALELGFGLENASRPARALLTVISAKDSAAARITATVDGVAAADLAAQVPVLGWLSPLEAPISGRLAAGLGPDGVLGTLEGGLEIGAGAVRPTAQTRPVRFDHAAIRFSYAPAEARITFTDMTVESRSLRLNAQGRIDLQGLAPGGAPQAFLAQVQVTDLAVDPEGQFVEPVHFSAGDADLRLSLNPFRIDVGQVSLREDGRRLLAHGFATAAPAGWNVGLDLSLNTIPADRLLALWPVSVVPKTRGWLQANVQQGALFNVQAALRSEPGSAPKLSLGYEFAGADVRFMRTMPPIDNGHGYATLFDTAYTIVLDRGTITPPLGGAIDMAGSVFRVPDITQRPNLAAITLKTDSTITAAMSLMDEPPFRFLTRAGRAVQVAEGRAVTVTHLTMPLANRVTMDLVDYSMTGRLTDVVTDRLVPGRRLTADALAMTADKGGMTISGPGQIGAVPFAATWTQPFGTAGVAANIAGEVTLSPAFVSEFGIGLPDGAISGAATAQIMLDLPKAGSGAFQLTSDMAGMGVAISAIAYAKSAATAGSLTVSGRLGAPPQIDTLTFDAPGLTASGSITLRPGGGLELARFDRVQLGDWLDAAVDLRGQGAGQPLEVALTGGEIDLRRMPAGGVGGGGGDAPLAVTLDRLRVSEKIALTGLTGRFNSAGGFNGDFTAAVNGTASVTGAVVPSREGTAVRIRSDDAGAVLAAAGVFPNARGGGLDLTLTPRGGQVYDGQAALTDVRVRDVPILAELMNAISVVGLLDQMNNAGLVFSNIDATFRITPDRIEVTEGAAVGLSLGVSMAGLLDLRSGIIDMQGVFSPVYLINGIGSLLTRPGEGLFGFSYRLGGKADDPQVSVNPLSILSPGMFREIFRRPAPTLKGTP